ncbi:hypothetical protein EDD11_000013 [Mortierella claussenii]|nr:hypothetical protein EDD11_000013 [Mortierella claussenii]
MSPVRIVSLDNVATILKDIDLEDILTSQAKAFHAYTANETQTPQRSTLNTHAHTTLIMPSRIDTLASAIKIVSVPKADSKKGLPGVALVMDNDTAEPRGLVNARLLTAVRTAAGSALATRAIFQNRGQGGGGQLEKSHLTLVVFGSGAQAKSHVQLLIHVLPQIQSVIICNRTLPRAHDLVQELQPQYSSVKISAYSISTGESTIIDSEQQRPSKEEQLKQIVQSADVICTCTNSKEALFPGEWVRSGTHLNMIGSYTPEMHEVDQTLVQRAHVLVDALSACAHEAGELILAKKQVGKDGVLAEMGQIFDNQGQLNHNAFPPEFKALSVSPSQTEGGSNKDVTIFKSVGIAAQDVAITALVLDKAEAKDIGTVVEI